ncbi:MAG: hypothetical protein WCE30_09700 [Mycobacterium sp.]
MSDIEFEGPPLTQSPFRVDYPGHEFIGGTRMRAVNIGRRVSDLPIFEATRERKYRERLADHSTKLPILSVEDEAVVQSLAATCIVTRQIRLTEPADNAARQAVNWLRDNSTSQPVTYLPPKVVSDDPALFTWGLSEQNLDIAERYIGLPVRYLGMEVKVEHARPVSEFHSARNWHIDIEDRRMLKVIVYLNDVDEHVGPFEYIPATVGDTARTRIHWRPGFTFLGDREFAEIVPPTNWKSVIGPATTAIYVDTSRLLHRIREPRSRARYSVTYVYTSNRPRHALSRFMPTRLALRSLMPSLTQRQRLALAGKG